MKWNLFVVLIQYLPVWCRLSLVKPHSKDFRCMHGYCQTLMFHIRSDKMQRSEMQVQNVQHVVLYPMQFLTISNHIDFYPIPYANNPKLADNFDQPNYSSNALLLACLWKKTKKKIQQNNQVHCHQHNNTHNFAHFHENNKTKKLRIQIRY